MIYQKVYFLILPSPFPRQDMESADLVILRVTFDAKMTFEKHLRSVSSAAAQRLGIVRKSWQVFRDRSLLLRSLWSFVLPVLKYCSAV